VNRARRIRTHATLAINEAQHSTRAPPGSAAVRTSAIAAAAVMVALTGANAGCAHKQPTNKQIAIGAAAVVGLGLLLYLAVQQCDKGANYCDNSPPP